MGQVWEAHDGTLERPVAVKVITRLSGGGSQGDKARTRFLREARITGLLQHPNIVTVHDLGETDGQDGKAPFLVMELVRGEGLDLVLSRGPVSLAQAAEWSAQICDALAEAHRAGVLHRDIKPSNIQVMPSGATKVLDFGIARAADPYATADRLTQTGFIVGTPPYMAPEQARGNPEARSDLYALGCLLFEMITGSLPFQAPDPIGYIAAHLTQEPPAPSTLAMEIPPAWDDVVLTLLRKDPRERYENAAAVARALRQLGQEPWHPPTVVDIPDVVAELAAARRAQNGHLATALRRLELRRTLERGALDSVAELAGARRGQYRYLSTLLRRFEHRRMLDHKHAQEERQQPVRSEAWEQDRQSGDHQSTAGAAGDSSLQEQTQEPVSQVSPKKPGVQTPPGQPKPREPVTLLHSPEALLKRGRERDGGYLSGWFAAFLLLLGTVSPLTVDYALHQGHLPYWGAYLVGGLFAGACLFALILRCVAWLRAPHLMSDRVTLDDEKIIVAQGTQTFTVRWESLSQVLLDGFGDRIVVWFCDERVAKESHLVEVPGLRGGKGRLLYAYAKHGQDPQKLEANQLRPEVLRYAGALCQWVLASE
ncbi:hypothetical protein DN069_28030 [Streptacidiphilus pinicola]|uniref:non-specific serine/threonine protein kinase n=2 Tax=Streptacidiphilus pinicola TaxID=2219663 RepID=A0A2X0K4A9_9ACTN|nr:hypothetical protein DN069_28030 [Streptacidiphilus pinicola]